MRDYEGALALFDEALTENKGGEGAELHAGRARSLYLMRDFSACAMSFNEAILLEPENPQWRVGLGMDYLAVGDNEAAAKISTRKGTVAELYEKYWA